MAGHSAAAKPRSVQAELFESAALRAQGEICTLAGYGSPGSTRRSLPELSSSLT